MPQSDERPVEILEQRHDDPPAAAESLTQVTDGCRTMLGDERPHLCRRLRHGRGAHDELGADLDDLASLDQVFQRPGPNYKKDDSAMKTIFAQL